MTYTTREIPTVARFVLVVTGHDVSGQLTRDSVGRATLDLGDPALRLALLQPAEEGDSDA